MKDANGKKRLSEEEIEKLNEFIGSIRFGSVSLVIQDGVLVQMERNEKVRFTREKTHEDA
jgi:hypothetical protein